MAPKLEHLLIAQELAAEKLLKQIRTGKTINTEKRTAGFIQNMSEQIKKGWDEFDERDTQIRELIITSKKSSDDPYFTEDKYSTVHVSVLEYLGELVDGMLSSTPQQDTTMPIPGTTILHTTNSRTPLPKIHLPKFDGNYNDWRSFHDYFSSLVHNNVQLQPIHKLHYLKECLTGEAASLLKNIPITESNYGPAWDRLKARYENKRLLINTQLKGLTDQPKMNFESSNGLKALLDTTEGCLQQLEMLGENVSSWDTIIIFLLVKKLPLQTVKLWEEELQDSQNSPDMKKFKQFIQSRYKVLESIAHTTGHCSRAPTKEATTKKFTQSYYTASNAKCPACDNKHYVGKCSKFLRMNAFERRGLIKASGRCFNCFSSKHTYESCKQTCSKCHKSHHTLLHISENSTDSKANANTEPRKERVCPTSNGEQVNHPTRLKVNEDQPYQDERNTSDQSKSFLATKSFNGLLSTALVKALAHDGQLITLRCLIDPGSQSSFITEQACKRLQLKTCHTSVVVNSLNASQTAHTRKQVNLALYSQFDEHLILTADMLVLKQITDLLPATSLINRNWGHITGLQLADPTYWKAGPVHMLLGVDVYATIIQDGIKRGQETEPIALNTKLGWLIMGKNCKRATSETSSFTIVTELEEDLDVQLRRFWEQEEILTKRILTTEERECENIYKNTCKRLENGQYQVKLPFVAGNTPNLGESRKLAAQRFRALQRRFERSLTLKEEYTKCLEEYIDLQHMERVHSSIQGNPHYYIPHHAVFKDSTTTKLRIVFDASARSSNGKSLNEQLLVGPTLQPKLFATVLKWRKHKIAITADIEKMYRMILVHPDHRTYQRILWQHENTNELQDYQLKTVTFGTTSAPYLAVRTLQQLAEDSKSKWPEAAKVALTDFYVDDVLTGSDSVDEAKLLRNQLISMLKSGGFNLRKWASNNKDLLIDLPVDQLELKPSLDVMENETIKTVGLKWHPELDYFSFAITKPFQSAGNTKRTMLSAIASLFDPLGWLAPITIVAKVLIQTLWMSNIAWDAIVSEPIQRQWEAFKTSVSNLTNIQIPRWVGWSCQATSMQLHGFSDSSVRAYAAAVYLRVQNKNGEVTCHLLTTKTKVAPIKPITLPRLELNGAVLLTRLMTTVLNDMQLTGIPLFAWTDSMITLQWIQDHPTRWKTYVANRVSEIQDAVPPRCWHHVSSVHNPADVASRGCTAEDLKQNSLWWHGPAWLSQQSEKWPKLTTTLNPTNLEAKREAMHACLTKVDDDFLQKFSSFHKLIRVTAMVLRFANNVRKTNTRRTGWLSTSELQEANNTICRLVQKLEFSQEYTHLTRNQPIPSKSKLLNLNPHLSSDGLIRVGGRLANANLPYSNKFPIILPRDHHVTQLIVDKFHTETLHGGPTLTLNATRNEYWILNAKGLITKRIHQCVICARHRKSTYNQLMGNLPSARVNISKPFTHVGLDYAGPIMIKTSPHKCNRKYKGYICVFVCMATRAMHLEAVSDLTAATFISAIKRFISRRGRCTDIYSDCGTNFVGGKNQLNKDLASAIKQYTNEVGEQLALKGIKWHFNPPASPHFGGLWEAGVKSVKYHLKRTLGETSCTYEELATLLAQIEACLNSRPLCAIGNNVEDLEVLTPAHFLIGQALSAIPEPEHGNVLPFNRWRYTQQLIQNFWRQWKRGYLHRLQERSKWKKPQVNLTINDVVLIKDENTPPTHWPLGIIIEAYPGKDGLIRVVKIRTKNNTLLRPITKVCRLPVETPPKHDSN